MFNLARELARKGNQVSLFTGYPRFKVDDDLRAFTQTYPYFVLLERLRHRLPLPGSVTSYANLAIDTFGAWMGRAIRNHDVEVLDALAGSGWEAGREVQRRGGVYFCNRGSAHVLTQKALLDEEYPKWGQRPPYFSRAGLDRCLGEYQEANGIIVPSTFARESFIQNGVDPSRLHLCPYGVELDMFSAKPRDDKSFRAIFVGAQSIRKGLGYLFQASKDLVEKGAMELWLVGSELPETSSLRSQYNSTFNSFGVRPRNILSWFYSQADVLVLPSIEEGLALVQAQAMACGLPVIATPSTGAPDLFTDGVEGFIIPTCDGGAIREKLEWMITHPQERLEMGKRALDRVKNLGGWCDYASRSLEVYRHTLNAR